jgi:glycosyltransferase involved in cell wall biosynthesis
MSTPALAGDGQTADVCVVIPTRGRPQLLMRAVDSALAQSLAPSEVLVVVDGPDPETEDQVEAHPDPRVRLLRLPVNRGAAGARNAGVRAARSAWIAFLDDDDEWLPDKLADQWADVIEHARPRATVFATGVEWRSDHFTHQWPTRGPRPGEAVADYLFVRTRPGEGLLATPTILLTRDLARDHPFREDLRVHEDFDWFLDLDAQGIQFHVVLKPLVVVHAPRVRISLSSQSTWQASLGWALHRRSDMSSRAFSSFCLTEVLRGIRGARRLRPMIAVVAVALTGRTTPFDLGRALAIWAVPEDLRWRLRGQRR